jgi:putative ABC transport system substrate-binding protein
LRDAHRATGVTFLSATLDAKLLGLLHELFPQAKAIASLLDPNYPTSASQLKDLHDAAGALRLQIHVLQVSNEGSLTKPLPPLRICAPMRSWFSREFPVAGGLISYGASVPDAFRQAGVYTGRILKGQNPAEMLVLQPTKFDLVINLKTAKASRPKPANCVQLVRRSDSVGRP